MGLLIRWSQVRVPHGLPENKRVASDCSPLLFCRSVHFSATAAKKNPQPKPGTINEQLVQKMYCFKKFVSCMHFLHIGYWWPGLLGKGFSLTAASLSTPRSILERFSCACTTPIRLLTSLASKSVIGGLPISMRIDATRSVYAAHVRFTRAARLSGYIIAGP